MRFSEKWLREWVDPNISTEELAHQLTMAGLEVDAIEPVAAAFESVVVGHVTAVEPHPDADKLRVCRVDVGTAEPLQIVCGAPNVHEGMRAPTALIGARLPGGLKIKPAKLRGVASSGMLCSAKELGLSDAAEGLMPLPKEAPVGTDLREYLGLEDFSIELGLTPNRGDCLGIEGIAREAAVLNRLDLSGPVIEAVAAASDATVEVEVEAAADCPRYIGRVIRGLNPAAPTPLWMQERLRRSGLRSLGPLVDVTNYVLLELGQPMHAFDLDKLSGAIRVRRGRSGEQLELLNGATVEVDPDTLVIADESGPQALAGIMGGEATAVDDNTRNIFLESAFFSPAAIMGRARRYGLHTDSSHRFERGVSPELQRRSTERATALLRAICGGEPGPVVEVSHEEHLPARTPVRLRHSRLERVLGTIIPHEEAATILTRLGIQVTAAEDGWECIPPAFRFDLAIEEDLIEEVGRIFGYDRIPATHMAAELEIRPAPEGRLPDRRLRQLLVARGYQEAITYSFVEPELQRLLDPAQEPIPLANPISADLSVMRTSLWPALVQALQHNVNRQQERVRLFELGLRFRRQGSEILQEKVIGGTICGPAIPEQWGAPNRPVDFFDIKGDVEALVGLTGRSDAWSYVPAAHPALHPGQSARIELNGQPVGWVGALHPRIADALGIAPRVFLFELLAEAVFDAQVPKFREPSRFPALRRDIAVVVDDSVSAADLLSAVRSAAPATLRDLKIFDLYRGEGIDPGRKSIALGLTLQDDSRTLTDADVDAAMDKVVAVLRDQLGALLRQ